MICIPCLLQAQTVTMDSLKAHSLTTRFPEAYTMISFIRVELLIFLQSLVRDRVLIYKRWPLRHWSKSSFSNSRSSFHSWTTFIPQFRQWSSRPHENVVGQKYSIQTPPLLLRPIVPSATCQVTRTARQMQTSVSIRRLSLPLLHRTT